LWLFTLLIWVGLAKSRLVVLPDCPERIRKPRQFQARKATSEFWSDAEIKQDGRYGS
jgi:hypothetical protein